MTCAAEHFFNDPSRTAACLPDGPGCPTCNAKRGGCICHDDGSRLIQEAQERRRTEMARHSMEIEMECVTLKNGRLSLKPSEAAQRPRGKYFAAIGSDREEMVRRAQEYFGAPVLVKSNAT